MKEGYSGIIGVIIVAILFLSIGLGLGYSNKDSYKKEIVDCYDRENNKIIGVECESYRGNLALEIGNLLAIMGTFFIIIGIFALALKKSGGFK